MRFSSFSLMLIVVFVVLLHLTDGNGGHKETKHVNNSTMQKSTVKHKNGVVGKDKNKGQKIKEKKKASTVHPKITDSEIKNKITELMKTNKKLNLNKGKDKTKFINLLKKNLNKNGDRAHINERIRKLIDETKQNKNINGTKPKANLKGKNTTLNHSLKLTKPKVSVQESAMKNTSDDNTNFYPIDNMDDGSSFDDLAEPESTEHGDSNFVDENSKGSVNNQSNLSKERSGLLESESTEDDDFQDDVNLLDGQKTENLFGENIKTSDVESKSPLNLSVPLSKDVAAKAA